MKPIRIFTCTRLRALFIFLLAVAMNPIEPAEAGPCATASLDTMSSAASRSKFGFTGCQATTPPTYYLVDTTYAFFSGQRHTVCSCEPGVGYNIGSENMTTVSTFNRSQAYFTNGLWTAPETTTCSGSATYDDNITAASATYGWDQEAGEYDWSDGGIAAYYIDSIPYLTNNPHTSSQCTQTFSETDNSVTGSDHSDDGQGDTDTFTSSWVENTIDSVSEEYTDAMLRSDVIAIMPAYPSIWSNNSKSSAYYHLGASCAKMKYRIHLTDCVSDPNVSYRVHWDEVTTYDNGGSSTAHMQETIPGSADVVNGVVGSEHEIPVPGTPGTVTVTLYNPPEIILNGPPGQ